MRPVIFLGPTLARADAEAILDADYRPPAALADVWRATNERPPAIGIIDGYFHSVPSVWHKEILWALQQGIAVFGAASMGALRAAELHRFGMIGVGRIYAAYASGELQDDDEVALAHSDASLGYRPLSEPMVNIRATLALATRERVLSEALGARLEAAAKARFYPDRIWPEILRSVRAHGDQENAQLHEFEQWVSAHRVDQKRSDAVALLETMRAPMPDARPSFQFRDTVMWRALLEREVAADHRAVLEQLALEPALFDEVIHETGSLDARALASLRRRGVYEALLQQARQKQARAREASGRELPERDALLCWFFEELLGAWPDDLPAFLRARGWVDDERLAAVAAREFRASR